MVDLHVAGGTVTTSNLVSQALIWLYQHPDERRRLMEHPELLDRAIEEFLRCFAPSQALARTVIQDVEFFGCSLKKGDRALLVWASANRDRPAASTTPTSSTSSGGRTGTRRSASASTGAPGPTSDGRWASSC
jgi:hypothetical protein